MGPCCRRISAYCSCATHHWKKAAIVRLAVRTAASDSGPTATTGSSSASSDPSTYMASTTAFRFRSGKLAALAKRDSLPLPALLVLPRRAARSLPSASLRASKLGSGGRRAALGRDEGIMGCLALGNRGTESAATADGFCTSGRGGALDLRRRGGSLVTWKENRRKGSRRRRRRR